MDTVIHIRVQTHTHTYAHRIRNRKSSGLKSSLWRKSESIYILKKKKNEWKGSLFSPSLTHFFSLSRPRLENSMLSFAKTRFHVNQWDSRPPPKKVIVEKREKEWVRVLEMEEERREGSDRGRRRTSSYNRLLGSVMKQLSDIFSCLLLSCFSICLSYQVFVSPSPSPLLCPLSLICLS